jgi:hypothetical protein
MSTKKTIGEWLNELPDGYRERAMASAKRTSWTAVSMCDALNDSMIWQSTPEGDGFWGDVYLHFEKGRKLPKLPKAPKTTNPRSNQ